MINDTITVRIDKKNYDDIAKILRRKGTLYSSITDFVNKAVAKEVWRNI